MRDTSNGSRRMRAASDLSSVDAFERRVSASGESQSSGFTRTGEAFEGIGVERPAEQLRPPLEKKLTPFPKLRDRST
jgi:hypothetical protein